MGEDLEKFTEKYPTYIEALDMLKQKDQRMIELEERYNGLLHDYDNKTTRIMELEKENAKLQSRIDAFNYAKSTVDYWVCRDKKVEELQEQLKNAIVPKFKKYQPIFFITTKKIYYYDSEEAVTQNVICDDCYYLGENDFEIFLGKKEHRFTIWENHCLLVDKTCVFATEAEAQKYLEERK